MSLDPAGPRGAIIAGGEASRFQGRPKGLERVGGSRILDRLVESFLQALGTRPLLVANDSEASTWRPELEVSADLQPGSGALGGIYTAVRHGTAPVVCLAWDLPFVPPDLIRLLADGLAGGYDAFLPESGGPRGLEPLCAAYGPGCGPAIEARLQAGDLRAIGFHADVKVGILSLDRVRHLGDPDYLFFNVNTADDLAKADELWRRHESSR